MSRNRHRDTLHSGSVADTRLPPRLVKRLANKSGASVAAGDVVIVSTANAAAFTTTTNAQNTKPIGIVLESIANNATGLVQLAGYASLVNVTASVTRGHYAESSTTAKKATGNSARRVGSFAVFTTGGTTPEAWLFGVPDNSVDTFTGAAAGGDLSGTYPNPTVSKVEGVDVTDGGTTGDVLTKTGALSATWQAPTAPGGHVHVVGEPHTSDGSTTTFTLVNEFEEGTVAAFNMTTGHRLGVTEVVPDQATISAAGTAGDSIGFDYEASML